MKDISFFICSLASGGAEHQLTLLADMLAKKGHRVRIITFAEVPDHYSFYKTIERVRLYHKSSICNLFNVFLCLLKLRTDCFISFGQRENFISIFPFLFKKTKYIACERNNTVGPPSIIEKILVSCLYRRADYVVCNSHSQGNYLSKCKQYLAKKIKVIHNYTDLDLFRFSCVPQNPFPQIGIFCRLEPQKNIKRFASAIKKLKDTTDLPFCINWYGNQHFVNNALQTYYDSFINQIKRDGLEKTIIIHDPVKNVHELLPKFDAIALPSLHEGFSNSISEAICCGKPMLVSNVSDNPVMVKDGFNGFLFDPTNTDEIAAAFNKFLHISTEQRRVFGHNSRMLAEKLFDKEKFISDYMTLIS